MKYLIALGVAALLTFPHNTLAQQEDLPCPQITDPMERLACYDRASQKVPSEPEPQAVTPSIGSKSVIQETPVQSSSASRQPSATSSAEQPAAPRSQGLFSANEKLNISSRLISIRDKDKQKMVFRLDNEQIWLQDSPRSLPFRKGDEVTIKSATIGGYILSNQKGLSTRVRRIK